MSLTALKKLATEPLVAAYGAAVLLIGALALWTGRREATPSEGQARETNNAAPAAAEQTGATAETPMVSREQGMRLVATYCLACHRNQASEELQRRSLGPTLWATRERYLEVHAEEEAFVRAMTDFMQAPTEADALMPGAVRQFGLMPRQGLPREDLEATARAVYHAEGFGPPEWWDTHERKGLRGGRQFRGGEAGGDSGR